MGYVTGCGISIAKDLSGKHFKAASENSFWVKARSAL